MKIQKVVSHFKGTFVPVHPIRAHGGKEIYTPMILNFGTRLSSVLRSGLLYLAVKKTLVRILPEERNE